VLDVAGRFRAAVIDEFAATYAAGRTPVPCIRCNERIKFGDLLETARDLGADALVTGHYARRLDGPGGPELHRAIDPARDQSWFLFATTSGQLAFLDLPIGAMRKSETRAMARRLGLPVADKPDSQDICFVPEGDHAALVRRLRPDAGRPGPIRHVDGRVVGEHQGLAGVTVGQRRGLGVALHERAYVVAIDAARNTVTVGPRSAGAATAIEVEAASWLATPERGRRYTIRHRLHGATAGGTVEASGEGAVVRLDEPQPGVAPGQACVVYDGERVLGGGWIRGTTSAPLP
jgi:tRNA-specific 2-thiouridylase